MWAIYLSQLEKIIEKPIEKKISSYNKYNKLS